MHMHNTASLLHQVVHNNSSTPGIARFRILNCLKETLQSENNFLHA